MTNGCSRQLVVVAVECNVVLLVQAAVSACTPCIVSQQAEVLISHALFTAGVVFI